MILYFSGTGNSKYVAKKIQSVSGDEVISINDLMKKGSKEEIKSDKALVFVCPTYAWRIPRVVEDFIRETKFSGNNEAYFVLTCGGDTGEAVNYTKKLCNEKGFKFKGLSSVIMPDNYIAMYDAPTKEEADKIVQKAAKKISDISKDINENKDIPQEKITVVDKLKSGVVNTIFYSAFVSAKGFYSTDKCISCGKCEIVCPLNNIQLVDGRPKWGKDCTHCMVCINKCPKEAIEYKNKTKGKVRNYL